MPPAHPTCGLAPTRRISGAHKERRNGRTRAAKKHIGKRVKEKGRARGVTPRALLQKYHPVPIGHVS